MPLDAVNPPEAAYEAVRSVVTGLAVSSAFRTPALRRAEPDALALSTPHRVAFLPLDRVRQNDGLRTTAQMQGWRFLILDGDRVVATTEAVPADRGGYQFGHLNEGPFTAGTEQAIRQAERLDIVHRGRFEPVLLRVPALYVTALWLRSHDQGSDMFLVIPPAPREFTPYKPMTEHDFMAVLRRLAEQVPKEGETDKGPLGG